jgi:ankyrin repeat protein
MKKIEKYHSISYFYSDFNITYFQTKFLVNKIDSELCNKLLFVASISRHLSAIKFLDLKNVDYTYNDYANLRYAIERDNYKILKFVIERKKLSVHELNFLLKRAAFFEKTKIMELLLKNGANVQSSNNIVLEDAVFYNNIKNVKMLLKYGATPNEKIMNLCKCDKIKRLLEKCKN